MQKIINVVKGSLCEIQAGRQVMENLDVEAGEWAAESFRIYHWLKTQDFNQVIFGDPELAYYSLLGKHLGFANFGEIILAPPKEEIQIRKRSDLERKFLRDQSLNWLEKKNSDRVIQKRKPNISVCVPHRNRPQALENLLTDLNGQTDRDFEVIVVDDGSSEAARKILERFPHQKWNFQLKVNFQNAQGARVARNSAVKASSGDLLVFIDDDNSALPWMIESFRKACMNSQSEIWVCPYERQFVPRADSPIDLKRNKKKVWLPLGGGLSLGALQNTYGDMNGAIRRSAYEKLGGLDESTTLSCEDWELLARAAVLGMEIAVIPEVLQIYRDHPDSFFKVAPRLLSELHAVRPYFQFLELKSNLPIEVARSQMLREYENFDDIFNADFEISLGIQARSGNWEINEFATSVGSQSGPCELSLLVACSQDSMITIESSSSAGKAKQEISVRKGRMSFRCELPEFPTHLKISWSEGLFVFRKVVLRRRG